MKKLIVICLLLLPLFLKAQQQNAKTNNRISFHSLIQTGFIKGNGFTNWQAQTINGIQYKTWSGGVGFGFDHYYPRSMPLFGEVRKNILNKSSTPYVFADLGSHILFVKKYSDDLGYSNDYESGAYYNLGAGYKLAVSQKFSLVFSGSYSVKEYSHTNTYVYPCYSMGPCPEISNKTNYVLRRFSLQFGFMF